MGISKLNIKLDKQNTLYQNLKLNKPSKDIMILLISKQGKQMYYGNHSNIPKQYLQTKVKSLNKSINKKDILSYILLDNNTVTQQTNPIVEDYKKLISSISKKYKIYSKSFGDNSLNIMGVVFSKSKNIYALRYICSYGVHMLALNIPNHGKPNYLGQKPHQNNTHLIKTYHKTPSFTQLIKDIDNFKPNIKTKGSYVTLNSEHKDKYVGPLKETYKGYDIYPKYKIYYGEKIYGDTDGYIVTKHNQKPNMMHNLNFKLISHAKSFINEVVKSNN